MPFDEYFDRRSRRFAAFYRSQGVARLLGRGALFDRLDFAVDTCVALGAKRVLDIGCGSGPLFQPLAARGIEVTGIEPAPRMVALATAVAERCDALVRVVQIPWEELVDWRTDAPYDVAVALGVFDYVTNPQVLFDTMAAVARNSIASFPRPSLRTNLRKLRYGSRGVSVSGYSRELIEQLTSRAGMETVSVVALGRAGYAVHARTEAGYDRDPDQTYRRPATGP
jgi:2-polyprenyl-3-methyl-5-hydroxy-6-metoxy-1,4-benzoquinol methylase